METKMDLTQLCKSAVDYVRNQAAAVSVYLETELLRPTATNISPQNIQRFPKRTAYNVIPSLEEAREEYKRQLRESYSRMPLGEVITLKENLAVPSDKMSKKRLDSFTEMQLEVLTEMIDNKSTEILNANNELSKGHSVYVNA